MAEDFRATIRAKYDLTDAYRGVCTLCSTNDRQATLEVYRHKDISVFFALFCPKCGSLFQLDVREME